MYGYIYKTTNLINDRIYIGQKKSVNFLSKYLGSGKILKQAVKKYGKDSFKVELVAEVADKKSADILEKYYIEMYRRELGRDKLYNIADGGLGVVSFVGKHHTEETKAKNRMANSGENNPNYGKPLSLEARENLRRFSLGRAPWNKGKHQSDETKERIRLSLLGENNPMYGKHFTEESKEKLRIANLGRVPWNKGKYLSEEYREKQTVSFGQIDGTQGKLPVLQVQSKNSLEQRLSA